MPRQKGKGPTLPASLLKELGVQQPTTGLRGGKRKALTRKDQRKSERFEKKTQRRPASKDRREAANGNGANNPRRRKEPISESEAESFDGLSDAGVDRVSSDPETEARSKVQPSTVSRTAKGRLAQDDAEIADLERKLGVKGRKSLPQSFHDDGLDDLLGLLDDETDDEVLEKKKRKAEADNWLAQKRRKSSVAPVALSRDGKERDNDELSGTDSDLDALEDDLESDMGDSAEDGEDDLCDESDMADLHDSSSEEGGAAIKKVRVRENPYVAPTVGVNVVKYIPPSRRQQSGSDAESTLRLRRQLQGLINRITESNLIAITGDIEKIFREQPRQHVTSIIVELLLTQVCDPASLPDTLMILTAGFATAVFKIIGMDFGAQIVQEIVASLDQHLERARSAVSEASKETSNLITFLAELYNFQLVGSNLIYDYIRLLLSHLSELNSELLLRIIRISGHSLRQDDPSALKDIVALIRPAVAKVGEANMSVRTKFMIETINDLKNNKLKAGAAASAVVSEHTVRMKKLLGSLNANKIKSTEPLRMGLDDIRNAEKTGKWWLVGASWVGRNDKAAGKNGTTEVEDAAHISGSEDNFDLGDGEQDDIPDLSELAREQMMNTDVRRSIFSAIVSASDCDDANVRLLKLRLNKERQREIPNVLIQCAGAEQQSNPFYTLIAKRLCADRKMRWAFQDCLWKLFRRLGESIFGDEADELDVDDAAVEMRRLVNVAKLYGALVKDGMLELSILKCLNLPYLQPKTKSFVEVMLITALLGCFDPEKTGSAQAEHAQAAISRMAAGVRDAPELTRGLQWFLKKVVRHSDLAGGKRERQRIRSACQIAKAALDADGPEPVQIAEEDKWE